MIAEGVLGVILSKLSVDKIYRLYHLSSIVRKIVDVHSKPYGASNQTSSDVPNRYFWRKLIERDLGVVPLWGNPTASSPVNLKLHYLRMLKFPIAGVVYGPDETRLGYFKSQYVNVIAIKDDIIIYSDGTIYDGLEFKHKAISTIGERMLEVGQFGSANIIFTNLRVIDLSVRKIFSQTFIKFINQTIGSSHTIVKISHRNFADHGVYAFCTLDGRCYYMGKNIIQKVPISEPIISVYLSTTDKMLALSNTGILYIVNVGKNAGLVPTFDQWIYRVQYLSSTGEILTIEGDIYKTYLSSASSNQAIVLGLENGQYIDKDMRLQSIVADPLVVQTKFEGVLQFSKSGIRLLT